jgi:hypothetical protein
MRLLFTCSHCSKLLSLCQARHHEGPLARGKQAEQLDFPDFVDMLVRLAQVINFGALPTQSGATPSPAERTQAFLTLMYQVNDERAHMSLSMHACVCHCSDGLCIFLKQAVADARHDTTLKEFKTLARKVRAI